MFIIVRIREKWEVHHKSLLMPVVSTGASTWAGQYREFIVFISFSFTVQDFI